MTDSSIAREAGDERSVVTFRGKDYERIVVRSHWIGPDEDLATVMRAALGPLLQPGDWAIVTEKVVVVTEGRMVPVTSVRPRRLARVLAARVRPREDSRGLSIPEKMQYVVEDAGRFRVLLAAAAGALTRPLGIHGLFYLVAGRSARSIDGLRPPYNHLLLPPLHPAEGRSIATRLAHDLGVPVAIVDMNDLGGSIRAVSVGGPSPRLLRWLLYDNPLSRRQTSTPFGVIRPLAGGP